MMNAVDAEQVLSHGPLQHRFGRPAVRRGAAGRLVSAVGAPLHQPELADVTRERRLGDVEPRGAHRAPQLLLAADGRALDGLEDRRLATGLHKSQIPDPKSQIQTAEPSALGLGVWDLGFGILTSKGYIKVLTDYASDCINILS